MSDDLHKKEAHAVQALRKGVARYAEDIRRAIQHARREAAAADQKVQQAVEHSRAELARADQELKHLQQTLSRAGDAERAELEAFAAAARQQQADAKRRLDNARQAASKVKAAQSDLLKVASLVDGKVSEHSSVAASALADLDAKIRAYSHGPNLFQAAVVTLGVAANALADGQGLVQTGADFAKAVGVEHSLVEGTRHKTSADLSADRDQNLQGLYADKRLEGDERRGGSSDGGKK